MFASALLALPKSVIKLPKTILQYAIRAAKVLPPSLIYLFSSSILYYCAIVLCVMFLFLFGHTQSGGFTARCIFLTLAFKNCAFTKTGAESEPEHPSIEDVSQLCVSVFQADIGAALHVKEMRCVVLWDCRTVGCVKSRTTFQLRLVFALAVFFSPAANTIWIP